MVHFIWWWRHQMETFSALLAICAGNSPASGEFPAQRPVTRCFDVFFDLCLNKRLRKQSRGWWFETLSRPLWRHRSVFFSVGSDLDDTQRAFFFIGLLIWVFCGFAWLLFIISSLQTAMEDKLSTTVGQVYSQRELQNYAPRYRDLEDKCRPMGGLQGWDETDVCPTEQWASVSGYFHVYLTYMYHLQWCVRVSNENMEIMNMPICVVVYISRHLYFPFTWSRI